jgi:hypothetical protein
MFTFASKVEYPSQSCEGVKFTVRVLNKIQRAQRDLELIPHQAETTRIFERMKAIEDPKSIEYLELDARYGVLINLHFKPAYIRAGLISVEGFEGIETAADLIDRGPDSLIDEVYEKCYLASGLTTEQQKNSSSASDSVAPVAEASQNTTATIAAQSAGTT